MRVTRASQRLLKAAGTTLDDRIYDDLIPDEKVMLQMRKDFQSIAPILGSQVRLCSKLIAKRVDALRVLKTIIGDIQLHTDKFKQEDCRIYSLINFCKILLVKDIISLSRYVQFDEELSIEETYTNAEEVLPVLEAHPETAPAALFTLYELAGYYYLKGDEVKSLEFFEKAETFFRNSQNSDFKGSFFVNECFFGLKIDPRNCLLDQYVFGSISKFCMYQKMQLSLPSIMTIFEMLQKMLEIPDYMVFLWAEKLASLSLLFSVAECFDMTNYCLSVAGTRIEEYQQDSRFDLARAELNYFAAKAGSLLLQMSYIRLNGSENFPVKDNTVDSKNNFGHLRFEELSHYEIKNILPTTLLKNYEEAKEVFVKSVNWLEDVKSVVSFEENADFYVKNVTALADIYNCFSGFEQSPTALRELLQKRVDELENLQKKISSNDVMNYELGDAYFSLMDIELNLLIADKVEAENVADRINQLRNQTVENYKKFLDSRNVTENDTFSKEVRRILTAKFMLGMAYNKLITGDIEVILSNMKVSLEEFKFLYDYCNSNSEAKVKLAPSYNISEYYIETLTSKVTEFEENPESLDVEEHIKWSCRFTFERRYLIND